MLCQLVCGSGRTHPKWSGSEVCIMYCGCGLVPKSGKVAECQKYACCWQLYFFDWDHVGILESCDGTTVYTVEGNSGDTVKQNRYSVNLPSVLGYGLVIY